MSDPDCNVSASSSESGINLWEWDQSFWPFPCGNLQCSIPHYFDSERAAFPAVSQPEHLYTADYPPESLMIDSVSLTYCSLNTLHGTLSAEFTFAICRHAYKKRQIQRKKHKQIFVKNMKNSLFDWIIGSVKAFMMTFSDRHLNLNTKFLNTAWEAGTLGVTNIRFALNHCESLANILKASLNAPWILAITCGPI